MVKRIPKCYVREDCAQVRFSFNENITIISSDFKREGIICYYNFNDDSQSINKYLFDSRKIGFPYSDVPIYKERLGNVFDGFDVRYCVNQILCFNKHYVCINDDFNVYDIYVIKDGEEAIIYSKKINIPCSLREEDVTKKDLYNDYKNVLLFFIDKNGCHINFKKYFNSLFSSGCGLFVVEDNNGVKFKMIDLIIRGRYYFKVEYDIPFNTYRLEELKGLQPKIKNISEPRIYMYDNPNLERKYVKEAKMKVKKLNKIK